MIYKAWQFSFKVEFCGDCQNITKQEASVYKPLNNLSVFRELHCHHLSEKCEPASLYGEAYTYWTGSSCLMIKYKSQSNCSETTKAQSESTEDAGLF